MQTKQYVRLQSLDALRGFDMFWIISGEGIFHGFANGIMANHHLIRNAGNWQIQMNDTLSFWERIFITISNQLHHTVWNGFTFYDMIFPLFIFIAGVSMPYAFGKQIENNVPKSRIYFSLIKRTLILILLGMVVNGDLRLLSYQDTRFASVLGRIALSCFFAAIIFLNCKLRTQIIWFIGILLMYWLCMIFINVPGFGAGNLTPEGNLSAYLDRLFLPGKLHRKIYDPEGLFSTLPAICSALLGVFCGQLLRLNKLSSLQKAFYIFCGGIFLIIIGKVWNIWFPINKNMWTSSFVLFAGGLSMLFLSIFYFLIDVLGWKKISMPFVWIGTNSILIYLCAHGLINFESTSQFLFGGVMNWFSEEYRSAVLWIGVLVIQLWALRFLYNKKLFWKI